jgi:hypothetical protein
MSEAPLYGRVKTSPRGNEECQNVSQKYIYTEPHASHDAEASEACSYLRLTDFCITQLTRR